MDAHNFKAAIPSFKVMRSDVIKNMPQDISEETILNEFSSAVKIVSVRRLFRKVRKDGKDELIPTQSVLAKFQDQNLPRALTFMHVSRYFHISSFPNVLCLFEIRPR